MAQVAPHYPNYAKFTLALHQPADGFHVEAAELVVKQGRGGLFLGGELERVDGLDPCTPVGQRRLVVASLRSVEADLAGRERRDVDQDFRSVEEIVRSR